MRRKPETRKPRSEGGSLPSPRVFPRGRGIPFGFRISVFGFLLLFVGCAGGASTSPSVGQDLLAGVERRVLPNGMAIVVREDHRLPTLTAMLAYRVGSVNEPEGLTGVSHFFEHMVFKGSAK